MSTRIGPLRGVWQSGLSCGPLPAESCGVIMAPVTSDNGISGPLITRPCHADKPICMMVPRWHSTTWNPFWILYLEHRHRAVTTMGLIRPTCRGLVGNIPQHALGIFLNGENIFHLCHRILYMSFNYLIVVSRREFWRRRKWYIKLCSRIKYTLWYVVKVNMF